MEASSLMGMLTAIKPYHRSSSCNWICQIGQDYFK